MAVFPEGTPGCALDTLARVPLWREGLNYRHGTGHGVGAALNVHEVMDDPYALGKAVCKQTFQSYPALAIVQARDNELFYYPLVLLNGQMNHIYYFSGPSKHIVAIPYHHATCCKDGVQQRAWILRGRELRGPYRESGGGQRGQHAEQV